MLRQLEEKFAETGVAFSNITITTITLPPDIWGSMEKTITQGKLIEKLEKDHENKVKTWRQEGDNDIQAIASGNQIKLVEEVNKKGLAEAELGRVKSLMEEEANAELAKAEERVNIMKQEANGNLRRATDLAASNKTRDLNAARNEVQDIKLRARDAYNIGIKTSQEKLAQAKREAQAIQRDAEVEINLEEQVALKRQHEIALAQRRVLSELAEKGEYNLVGTAGDDMLKSLLGGEFGALAS